MGVLCLSLFCLAVFSVLSSFTITSLRKRELVAVLISCGDYCFMSAPHDAMSWSPVFNSGISLSYSFTF